MASEPGGGGAYFRSLWGGMCRWDPGTLNLYQSSQGAKKIILTACHSGKLKLAFTSPDVISTSLISQVHLVMTFVGSPHIWKVLP